MANFRVKNARLRSFFVHIRRSSCSKSSNRAGPTREFDSSEGFPMPVIHHRDRPVILSASGQPSLSMVVNSEVGATSLSVWVTSHVPGEVVPLHTHAVEEVLTVVAG